MEFTAFKVAGIVGAVTATSTGAYGIYYFSYGNKQTIRERLSASLSGKKVFIGDYLGKASLSVKYNSFKNKPKKDNKDLAFEQLESWCNEKSSFKYSTSNASLKEEVETYCFFNVKTLLQELEGSKLKSDKGATDQEWISAWQHYNTKKSEMKLEIQSSETHLNGSSDVEGGKALHAWCTETSNKKMYEADSLLLAFKEWCTTK